MDRRKIETRTDIPTDKVLKEEKRKDKTRVV
jgi:hypothetical protein